jgi:glucose-1-phosphate cytidylyltransferase
LSFHFAELDSDGAVSGFRASDRSDLWINGGFFLFRSGIFDFIQPGEELVLEPFTRLIESGALMAYRHEGFWRAMDTLKDRQVLEDMVEQGRMPWRLGDARPAPSLSLAVP